MKIDSVDLSTIAVRQSQYPTDNLSEIMLLGRSNVGKSSFINSLVGRKNFARTSARPGKTQTLNFYLINNNFYLVDVPGYGYASVNKEQQKKFGLMIEEYLVNRKNLKHVMLLVDYRHKPTEDDILMYNYLKYYNKSVTIVATKYDKVKTSARSKTEKVLIDTLKLASDDKIVYYSAITKKGKEEVLSIMDSKLSSL